MVQTKKKSNILGNAYSNTIKAVDITGNVGKIIPTQQKSTVQAPSATSTPTPTQTSSNLKSTYGGVKGLDEYKNLVNQRTSALSNLNQANQLAMKYADNTALAQGYATQGAMLQNNANLQSAYINQAGGINQNFQNQLGGLEDKNVKTNFDNLSTQIANQLQAGTLTEQSGNALLQAYSSQLPQGELDKAQQVLSDALAMQSKGNTDQLTDMVMNSKGELSEADKQTIMDYGANKITRQEAYQKLFPSQSDQQGNATDNKHFSTEEAETLYDSQGIKVDTEFKGVSTEFLLSTNNSNKLKEQLGFKINDKDLSAFKNLINSNYLANNNIININGNYFLYKDGRFYKADSKKEYDYLINNGLVVFK